MATTNQQIERKEQTQKLHYYFYSILDTWLLFG